MDIQRIRGFPQCGSHRPRPGQVRPPENTPVRELQAYGMTVVPKEKMGVDDDFVERLRGAILRACEKRNGVANQ